MNVASRVLVLMVTLVTTGLVSACALRSGGGDRPGQVLVVLLPDTDDGNVGRIVVSNPEGSTELVDGPVVDPRHHDSSAADSHAQRVGRQAAVWRRPRHAAAPAATLHPVLPVRVRGADRRGPAASCRTCCRPSRASPFPTSSCVGHTDTTGHAAVERGARTAARQRGAQSPRRCRAHAVDHRRPTRTARPSSWCRPRTASSSRATAASKSRCDDPAIARDGSSCCAGWCRRSLVAVLSLYRPSLFLSSNTTSTTGWCARCRARPPSDRIVIVDVDERSLAAVGQWPWRRDVIGSPDHASARAGRGRHRRRHHLRRSRIASTASGVETDDALAETLRDGRVVLGYAMTFDGSHHDGAELRAPSRSVSPSSSRRMNRLTSRSSRPPAPSAACQSLSQAAGASGFLNAAPDPDGILRRVPLLVELRRQRLSGALRSPRWRWPPAHGRSASRSPT